jgi:hypothetical protein
MGVSISTKTLRIEINLTEQESRYIRKHLTLTDETRKLAIERMIRNQIEKSKKQQKDLF